MTEAGGWPTARYCTTILHLHIGHIHDRRWGMETTMIFIYVIRTSADEFVVCKTNSGEGPEDKRRVGSSFSTEAEARTFAEQLRGQAGGTEKASIVGMDWRAIPALKLPPHLPPAAE